MSLGSQQIEHTFNNNSFDSGSLGEIKAAEISITDINNTVGDGFMILSPGSSSGYNTVQATNALLGGFDTETETNADRNRRNQKEAFGEEYVELVERAFISFDWTEVRAYGTRNNLGPDFQKHVNTFEAKYLALESGFLSPNYIPTTRPGTGNYVPPNLIGSTFITSTNYGGIIYSSITSALLRVYVLNNRISIAGEGLEAGVYSNSINIGTFNLTNPLDRFKLVGYNSEGEYDPANDTNIHSGKIRIIYWT